MYNSKKVKKHRGDFIVKNFGWGEGDKGWHNFLALGKGDHHKFDNSCLSQGKCTCGFYYLFMSHNVPQILLFLRDHSFVQNALGKSTLKLLLF